MRPFHFQNGPTEPDQPYRKVLSAAMFRRFHSRPARLSCALGTSGQSPLIGHKNTKAAMPTALKSALRVRSLTLIFPPR
jgi:hypothetical protein